MNLFQLINKLFFFRKGDSFEDLDHEGLQSFQPFMINRWLSFYGRDQAIFTNDILNKTAYVSEDKNAIFKYYYNQIPKVRYKKISYVKKKKAEKPEDNSLYMAAGSNFLSKREIDFYLDLQEHLAK